MLWVCFASTGRCRYLPQNYHKCTSYMEKYEKYKRVKWFTGIPVSVKCKENKEKKRIIDIVRIQYCSEVSYSVLNNHSYLTFVLLSDVFYQVFNKLNPKRDIYKQRWGVFVWFFFFCLTVVKDNIFSSSMTFTYWKYF